MNSIGGNVYEGILPSGAHDIVGWNSKMPIFRELIERTRPKTIIEVGTWLGASAIHMAGICREIGLTTKIYCVDTWLGAQEFWTSGAETPERDLRQKNGYPQVYFDFLANVVEHGHQEVIVPVPVPSTIGSLILKHQGVLAELIYIDASHETEDVRLDVASYLPLLALGGVLFGDDAGWASVISGVRSVLGDKAEFRDAFWVYAADNAPSA
jgi:hypothetical protein